MAVTTNNLRNFSKATYVDNASREISAKDLRDGVNLIADVVDTHMPSAGAETSAELAQAWAESPTPPDPMDPTSKSAKTCAGEAATSATAAAGSATTATTKAGQAATSAANAASSAGTATTQAGIATTQAGIATTKAGEAAASALAASESADEILDLTAAATTLAPGASATASYNAGTGVLTLGIPEGQPGAGSGDVRGPASAVADRIAVFNGTTGKLLKDGGSTVALLAPKASPALTGTPTAPTATAATNTTQIATTAFVQANKASPAFTGTPTAPTATAGTNTTQIATTAFVLANAASGGGIDLLGTITTTSGSTQTLSGLVLTNYKFVRMVWNGVSNSIGGAINLNGVQFYSSIAASSFAFGTVDIELATEKWTAVMTPTGFEPTGDFNLNNASTTLSVSTGIGNFDAGSIRVYGMK